ncbi:aminopeptidase [Kickxella alabastrina]|uniref:Aminopeptidase n=1 Tax=Kickxella alabastrina TaxID=61397 RepID=A0ACC1IRT8_9FUNG|nr:aminopeptidase [Kickxella alabastrina]
MPLALATARALLSTLRRQTHRRAMASNRQRQGLVPNQHHITNNRQYSSSGFFSALLQTAKSKNPITAEWHGQPTHEGRPDLVAKDEVTPGTTNKEFEARRQKLVNELPRGSTLFAFGSRMIFVSPHVFHDFRQDSDFYYLTGWNEPDSVAVIEKSENAQRGYTMTMFVNPKAPEKELWEGPRNGLEAAVSIFGADEARPVSEFGKYAAELAARIQRRPADEGYVYADLDAEHGVLRSSQCDTLKQLLKRESMGSRIRRLTPLVQQLRLIKSDAEIRLMREAGRVSALAFVDIMKACRPGMCESTLQGLFEHSCKMALVGGSGDKATSATPDHSALIRPAYVPVFASGEHALCMHYVQNSAPMRDGDLILVDAGTEYAAYASDITRTFPVNGRFTDAQRDLYSALLSVQQQMISLCRVDAGYSLNEIHRRSTAVMATELKQIGFHVSSRDVDDHLYPHHISHYLGMDVHDTVDISRTQQLKRNMVVTVEPGIYVPYDNRFPKAFQGMGIRIEDDIVVGQTAEDMENLSASVPKTIEDIEACANS